MTQYEGENDVGGGGGELDDETLDAAWANAEERRSGDEVERDDSDDEDDDGPQPWAKASSGDVD